MSNNTQNMGKVEVENAILRDAIAPKFIYEDSSYLLHP
jgi:hypothetical protein